MAPSPPTRTHPTPTEPRRRGRQGSASLLCLAIIAFTIVITAALARAGGAVVLAARAQSVADVVALGAASHGPTAAGRIAAANGASLRSLQMAPDDVVGVDVELQGMGAAAAATSGPR